MANNMNERRVFREGLEIRANTTGKEIITGYAIVFEQKSENLGGFIETISRNALSGARIAGAVVTFNHDPDNVLARHPGTMSYKVDSHGLKISFEPANTTKGRDIKELIRRGDVRGMSFTFRIAKNGDRWQPPAAAGGLYQRTVTAIDIIPEMGPVTNPAYHQTDVGIALRSLDAFKRKGPVIPTQKQGLRNYYRALKLKIRSKKSFNF